jgi:group I intron endonuclease
VPLTLPFSTFNGGSMIVYLATNRANSKQYVGQTIFSLEHRWSAHLRDAKSGSEDYIHRAIRKYGIEEFYVEALHECLTKEEMDFVEIFYISLLNSKAPNGYNLTEGGEGIIGYCRPLSEETKEKIRVKATGRKASKETRLKMSISRKSRGRSGGHRKGFALSEEHKRNVSEAMKGRAFSKEHKLNLSLAMRGNKNGRQHTSSVTTGV